MSTPHGQAISLPLGHMELVEGQEIAKPFPKNLHTWSQSWLIVILTQVLPDTFVAMSEANVLTGKITADGRREFIVPDVTVAPVSAAWIDGDLAEPPLLGVEILSPGQTITELMTRANRLVSLGALNVWIIWPEKRRAWEVGREQFDEVTNHLTLRLSSGPSISVSLHAMWAMLDRGGR